MEKVFGSSGVLLMCAVVAIAGNEKKTAIKIVGAWTATEITGNSETTKLNFTLVLEFKEGKYSETLSGKQTEAGTFKVDTTQNPITIDFTVTDGMAKGKVQLGILKIEGDKLTLSLADHGSKNRPKDFDGASKVGFTVYKRNK